MRRTRIGQLLLFVALIAGSAACDTREPATPTTPTPPTLVTDTFNGTVSVNGATTFTFTTTVAGTVTATLQSVTPDSTAVLGLALGTWNGTVCQVVLANDRAQQGITVTGSVSGAGALCTRVFDVGQLTAPATIQIVVVHP